MRQSGSRMKREAVEILSTIAPDKEELAALPAVQRLSRMRAWMERRLWRRVRVRIPVAVTCGAEKRICVVSDISARGLRLSGAENLNVGDTVTVTMRGFAPLSGDVVWVEDKQAGVALKHNLLG